MEECMFVHKKKTEHRRLDHLPSAGPRKGAVTNTPVALPRCSLVKISAMTPPVFVREDAPNALAKKRRTNSDWMFGEHAAATLNAVNPMNEIIYTDLRPYNSDRGAQITGPRVKPNTKSDKPSVATSTDTSKSLLTPSIPLAKTELSKVTTNVDRDWRMAMLHFRFMGKLIASS